MRWKEKTIALVVKTKNQSNQNFSKSRSNKNKRHCSYSLFSSGLQIVSAWKISEERKLILMIILRGDLTTVRDIQNQKKTNHIRKIQIRNPKFEQKTEEQ